ncbi:MAG: DUF4118 domain-containing protein [Alphaproteobacteria bacterium]|nr:DUF4118 domain-containing protein [Alphaproteobacteria bacterium]MBU0792422.1 DUF4118 domain-containing protein [Alphaproteobacteria bacterium]MBU0876816.1 DUF4118 domain-containing protein [Alphaproteobacteria bacterium]MBU1769786.1 DUF4118 domain-containing protein [Alphaproteobacteria bacterium]
MHRIIDFGAAFRRNPWLGYALSLSAFAAALMLRLQIDDTLPPGFPYLTFFPAVIVTTFLAGLRPGLLCAALSGLASWYFFIAPFYSFGLDAPSALALAFYVFIVGVDMALIHFMHVAALRLRAEQDVTAGLYAQQRVMFQELQHRVANNMAFVASLLHLQKRRVKADPESASVALDEAQRRIEIMSRVHRRLYDPTSADRHVGQYFQDLCSDLIEATGSSNIVCLVDMQAIRLDIDRLMTLSLLVTELVTNSLKHAFDAGGGGTITLTLDRLDADSLALTVSDNGRGMPADFEPAKTKGLGTRIAQGLAGQLGGAIEMLARPAQGTGTRVVFQG